jgi:hypothetical protein
MDVLGCIWLQHLDTAIAAAALLLFKGWRTTTAWCIWLQCLTQPLLLLPLLLLAHRG